MPQETAIQISQLPALLKAKSREGFAYLYDRYSGAVYGIICKIVKHEPAGEELLQDVFVKVWKNIEQFDESKGSLFTWLLNIARNTCIDYLRSRNHKFSMLTAGNGEPEMEKTGDTVHTYHTEHSELRTLAYKLDAKYRQVIDLVYFWGYSQDEVAKMLNMPLGTVKTRSRTGIQHLRALYAELNN